MTKTQKLSNVIFVLFIAIWGYALFHNNDIAVSEACQSAHYISIAFYAACVFGWVYSTYHKHVYKRACCLSCLSGNHTSCGIYEEIRSNKMSD